MSNYYRAMNEDFGNDTEVNILDQGAKGIDGAKNINCKPNKLVNSEKEFEAAAILFACILGGAIIILIALAMR